jgi:hypothetical protein
MADYFQAVSDRQHAQASDPAAARHARLLLAIKRGRRPGVRRPARPKLDALKRRIDAAGCR